MLSSILDAKITKKIVRLGSRSSDERIAQFSLRNLEQNYPDASVNRQIGRELASKRGIEEKMSRVMNDIQIPEPSEDQIKRYLQNDWEEHLSSIYNPPYWITEYAARLWGSDSEEGEWYVKGKKGKGKGKEQSHLMGQTYYGLWKRGLDIAFIKPPEPRLIEKRKKTKGAPHFVKIPPTQEQLNMHQERMVEFFSLLGFEDAIPPIPTSNRPFGQLQNSSNVWSMSLGERERLAEHWEEEMRLFAYNNYLTNYRRLREQYEEACEQFEAVSDEVKVSVIFKCDIANILPQRKRRLLKDVDLIGCTTTGESINYHPFDANNGGNFRCCKTHITSHGDYISQSGFLLGLG